MRLLALLAILLIPAISMAQVNGTAKIKASEKKPAILGGSTFELALYADKNKADEVPALIDRKRIIVLTESVELEVVKRGSPHSEVKYDGQKYYIENSFVEEWVKPMPKPTPEPEPKTPPEPDPKQSPKLEPKYPDIQPKNPTSEPTKTRPTKPSTKATAPLEEETPTKPSAKVKSPEETEANAKAAAAGGFAVAGMSLLMILGIVVVSIAFALVPFLIAYSRGHAGKWGILALTLLVGSWCLLGWIVALIWALGDVGAQQTVIVKNYNSPRRKRNDDED